MLRCGMEGDSPSQHMSSSAGKRAASASLTAGFPPKQKTCQTFVSKLPAQLVNHICPLMNTYCMCPIKSMCI